jgi:hypothetical protein
MNVQCCTINIKNLYSFQTATVLCSDCPITLEVPRLAPYLPSSRRLLIYERSVERAAVCLRATVVVQQINREALQQPRDIPCASCLSQWPNKERLPHSCMEINFECSSVTLIFYPLSIHSFSSSSSSEQLTFPYRFRLFRPSWNFRFTLHTNPHSPHYTMRPHSK